MSLVPVFAPVGATAYRLDLAATDGGSLDLSSGSALDAADSFTWADGGSKLFAVERDISNPAILTYYNCSAAGDISTASFGGDISLTTSRRYSGIAFNADGTRVYVVADPSIYTYTLSSPFAGTATQVRSDNFSAGGTLFFNDDGTILFYTSSGLKKRTLSTPYDLSTAGSESSAGSYSNLVSVARGGTRLITRTGGTAQEYSGSAWDFASFTLKETLSVTHNFGAYAPNGRHFQVLDSTRNLTQYGTAN
jgi:hypothetical protein